MTPVRFVVIGLGGYGLAHIEAVRWLAQQNRGKLVGVVALDADRQARPQMVSDLEHEGVTLYASVEDFFQRGVAAADVLTVPIGIHEHVPVSIRALDAGLHVYCEKPVAATVQDVDRLIAAERRSGKKVVIGFQHLYSASMQRLKQMLCAGRLGRVRSIDLMCAWPRSLQYFTRNQWAGRMRVGDDWILDSPANNANAHYILNALYLASPDVRGAAVPSRVRAELWRAYRIESTDTVQSHIVTTDGIDVRVLVSHAGDATDGPIMHVTCDSGMAYWMFDEGQTTVRSADGRRETFDNKTHAKWRFNGFLNVVEAIEGKAEVLCTTALARVQTLAVNLMHESCPFIRTIPEEFVTEQEDWEMFPPNTRGIFRRVIGLDAAMHVAFHEGVFLSELGLPWTAGMESQMVTSAGYRHYPAHQEQEKG